MKNDQLLRATEEELIHEYETNIAPHVGLAVASIEMELQRRATSRLLHATERLTEVTTVLTRSSQRLEVYTKWLIALTLLLLAAAVVPAAEGVVRLFK